MAHYVFNVNFYTINNFMEPTFLISKMNGVVIYESNLNQALWALKWKIKEEKGIRIEDESLIRPQNTFAGETLKRLVLYGADSKMLYGLVIEAGRFVPLTSSDEYENFGVKERFYTLENAKFTHPADEDNWQEGFMFTALHGANIKAYALPKDGAGIKTAAPWARELFAVALDGKWVIFTYSTDENGEARWGSWLNRYTLAEKIDDELWNVVDSKGYAIVSHGGRKCSICCPDKKRRIDVSEHVDAVTNPIRIFDKLNSYDSFSEK